MERGFWTWDRVRLLRQALRLTIQETAGKTGLSLSTLSRLENGRQIPSAETERKLDVLSLDLLDLKYSRYANLDRLLTARAERYKAKLNSLANSADVVASYVRERLVPKTGTITVFELYEDYCYWCELREMEPLAFPTFGRGISDLGIGKTKIGDPIHFVDVALRGGRQTPLQELGPRFGVVAGKLDRIAVLASDSERRSGERLHQELRINLQILRAAAKGAANQFPELLTLIDRYNAAVSKELENLDVAEVWSVGAALYELLAAYRNKSARNVLAEQLEPGLEAALASVARIHGAFILGFAEGRELTARAEAFANAPASVEESSARQKLLRTLAGSDNLVAQGARRFFEAIAEALDFASWSSARTLFGGYVSLRNSTIAILDQCAASPLTKISEVGGAVALVGIAINDPSGSFAREAAQFISSNSQSLFVAFQNTPELRSYIDYVCRLIATVDGDGEPNARSRS